MLEFLHQRPEAPQSLADVVAQVKPAVVSVTAIYTETVRAAALPHVGRSHGLGEQRESTDAPASPVGSSPLTEPASSFQPMVTR